MTDRVELGLRGRLFREAVAGLETPYLNVTHQFAECSAHDRS